MLPSTFIETTKGLSFSDVGGAKARRRRTVALLLCSSVGYLLRSTCYNRSFRLSEYRVKDNSDPVTSKSASTNHHTPLIPSAVHRRITISGTITRIPLESYALIVYSLFSVAKAEDLYVVELFSLDLGSELHHSAPTAPLQTLLHQKRRPRSDNSPLRIFLAVVFFSCNGCKYQTWRNRRSSPLSLPLRCKRYKTWAWPSLIHGLATPFGPSSMPKSISWANYFKQDGQVSLVDLVYGHSRVILAKLCCLSCRFRQVVTEFVKNFVLQIKPGETNSLSMCFNPSIVEIHISKYERVEVF
ncbi:unnamed protein product [Arabis nemorensis]|uniref:Uncharacterized protein n=1 Tax=Arabis nemorensis TaxID=586526 RepID=A0A565BAS5_9BRAS|nr:unnamed protein product [Arabis nemorensis]